MKRLGVILTLFLAQPVGAEKTLTYVAAGCFPGATGTTPKAALAACRKIDREMQRERGRGAGCDCAKSQMIELQLTDSPAYFFDHSNGKVGASRSALVAACRATEGAGFDCDARIIPVFGPFKRRAVRAVGPYDSLKDFPYLGSDGFWYDKNGESPCFVTGTQIDTPTGERAIETLAPGDAILSWDRQQGARITGRITRVKRRTASALLLRFADGRTLGVTANHPLAVGNRWVPAGELQVGDRVSALAEGTLFELAVTAIERNTDSASVYDLTVEPSHSYFASGVLVHNY